VQLAILLLNLRVICVVWILFCGYDPRKIEQFLGQKEYPTINSTPKLAILLKKDANFFHITKG
jgi:hypothetical protein